MNKKISILGCGWLGEELAYSFIKLGFSVKGSTTSLEKIKRLSENSVNSFLINIDNLDENIFDFLDSDILVIALTSKNIQSFKNLISNIELSRLKKIIFISSTSVYNSSEKPIDENSPINNSILSEIEKLFLENGTFSTTIIRFAGLFGYNRKPGNFYTEGKIIPNPEGVVNMIHRDDCVLIIQKIIEKDIWNITLNACADSHPKRREFFTKAAFLVKKNPPVFDENGVYEYKFISNERLKKILNYNFIFPDILKAIENNYV